MFILNAILKVIVFSVCEGLDTEKNARAGFLCLLLLLFIHGFLWLERRQTSIKCHIKGTLKYQATCGEQDGGRWGGGREQQINLL